MHRPPSPLSKRGDLERDRMSPWRITSKGVPGIDINAGGIAQANIVARGFNNAFSGALLTLQDYRFAAVPSLRVNVPFLFTGTNEDIERVEVLLGPPSALYGPNSANGVLHIITKSPFTSQGTTLTLDGGERSILRGAGRHAGLIGSKAGYKLSGEYFTGTDWKYYDPGEPGVFPSAGPSVRVPPARRSRDFDDRALRRRGAPRPSPERQHGSHHHLRLHEGARWPRAHRRERHRPDQELEVPECPAALSLESVFRPGVPELQRRRQQRQHLHRRHVPAAQRPADRGQVARVRRADPARDATSVRDTRSCTASTTSSRTREPATRSTAGTKTSTTSTELGGYVQYTGRLSKKFEVVGALRGDRNDQIEGTQISPRAALSSSRRPDAELPLHVQPRVQTRRRTSPSSSTSSTRATSAG